MRSAALFVGMLAVVVTGAPAVPQPTNGVAPPGQTVRDLHRPDRCEQLFDVPGVAKGLIDQCEGKGGGAGVAKGDFNADGFADLAIGAPLTTVNGAVNAGAVHVFLGSASGLTSAGNQLWTQESSGIPGISEDNDLFGLALASGDFDGDTYSDLAIGIPNEEVNGLAKAGRVVVVYGSAVGLNGARVQDWTASAADVQDCAGGLLGINPGCRMGAALVWADFNDDAKADLAIGLPNRQGNGVEAGGVVVLMGARGVGLAASNRDFIKGYGTGSHVGSVLAAGDLNGDYFVDLIVGVPDADTVTEDEFFGFEISRTANTGYVEIHYSSAAGFEECVISFPTDPCPITVGTISQGTDGVPSAKEAGDRFGSSVTVGDFNNDGFGDLVVGVPFEDVGDAVDAGIVHIFPGSTTGPRTDTDIMWDQSAFPGQAVEAGDLFGWSLAMGRFNSGNFADLAIGVPGEDFNSLSNAGAVNVAYGSSGGIQTTLGAQTWTMVTNGVDRGADAGDRFGFALTAWNFGNGDRADLVVGIPYRDVRLFGTTIVRTDAGAILALYGQLSGLVAGGNQLWTLDSPGILGASQSSGRFGYSLY